MESQVKIGQVINAVTGVSTFKDSVICRTGKMAQKNIFQCFGGSSKKKKKKTTGGGGGTSEQIQPKQNLSRSYAQIVESLSLVSYAFSVLDTFENMKHGKKLTAFVELLLHA